MVTLKCDRGVSGQNRSRVFAAGDLAELAIQCHGHYSRPEQTSARFARTTRCAFVIDAAQAIVHVPQLIKDARGPTLLLFQDINFSAAPVSAPWLADKTVLDRCDVYQGGGGMISLVEHERSTYIAAPANSRPARSRSAKFTHWAKRSNLPANTQKDTIHASRCRSAFYADAAFEKTGVRYIRQNRRAKRSPLYSFEIPGVHAHDTGTLLDEQDICVRAGHHCCQPLMRSLGVSATARASFSVYNTRDDVDRLIDGIGYVKKIFRKDGRNENHKAS
jgi:cysteine desulfurase/selenocysteine lyase